MESETIRGVQVVVVEVGKPVDRLEVRNYIVPGPRFCSERTMRSICRHDPMAHANPMPFQLLVHNTNALWLLTGRNLEVPNSG